MKNQDVAVILARIADILQINGENWYKAQAYRKAANSISNLDEDISIIYEKGRIKDIPGVGNAIEAKIGEIIQTGSCEYYEKLIKEVPLGVLEMINIEGLGYKSVKIIHDNLGIESLEELLLSCQKGEIRNIPGLGLQTEKNIIRGIEKLKKRSGKIRLGIALPLAQKFLDYLLERPSIISDAAITGSVRRGKAMVSDIDLLLASNNPEAVYEYVKSYKAIRQVDFFNNDLIKGQLSGGIKFEIIIATPSDYYYKLVWTTGSKDHREHLFSSNRCQVYKNFNSENEVYTRMGMDFIVPELREDEGEIEAAINGSLPKLITNNQIKGDLHVHTNWSDGSERIEDIAVAAYQKGYEYIAITDHSKSLKISGGLSEEMLINQGKVIDALNMDTSRDDFSILKGTEVDILKTGELDFPDPILEQLDIVIASVHSNFKMDKIEQTERIIQAIKNENVDIIGHLTGRLLSRRSGYEIEIDDIIDACARYNTALEINSHPDRMDINDKIARKARECGVKIAINSDAHRKKELDLISYGVTTARRGWLETKDVLNACSRDELLNRL